MSSPNSAPEAPKEFADYLAEWQEGGLSAEDVRKALQQVKTEYELHSLQDALEEQAVYIGGDEEKQVQYDQALNALYGGLPALQKNINVGIEHRKQIMERMVSLARRVEDNGLKLKLSKEYTNLSAGIESEESQEEKKEKEIFFPKDSFVGKYVERPLKKTGMWFVENWKKAPVLMTAVAGGTVFVVSKFGKSFVFAPVRWLGRLIMSPFRMIGKGSKEIASGTGLAIGGLSATAVGGAVAADMVAERMGKKSIKLPLPLIGEVNVRNTMKSMYHSFHGLDYFHIHPRGLTSEKLEFSYQPPATEAGQSVKEHVFAFERGSGRSYMTLRFNDQIVKPLVTGRPVIGAHFDGKYLMLNVEGAEPVKIAPWNLKTYLASVASGTPMLSGGSALAREHSVSFVTLVEEEKGNPVVANQSSENKTTPTDEPDSSPTAATT